MTVSTEVSVVDEAGEVAQKRPTSPMSLTPDLPDWTPQQLAAIRAMGAEGASKEDLDIFRHLCVKNALDPFARDAYLITRMVTDPNNRRGPKVPKSTIQTGIDGYRKMAHRAALRAGDTLSYNDEGAEWCGPDGKWKSIWTDKANPPAAARITVLRNGLPFPGKVMYDEYVQMTGGWDGGGDPSRAREPEPNSMWKRMPANQLAKCAEAQALRRAFPNDLAGIYIDEEMPMVVEVDTEGNVVESTRRRSGVRYRAAVEARTKALTAAPEAAVEESPAEQAAPLIAAAEAEMQRRAAQRVKLAALFTAAGATERQDKLDLSSAALDREVTDPTKLTVEDIDVVVAFLEARAAARDAEPATVEAEDTQMEEPMLPTGEGEQG